MPISEQGKRLAWLPCLLIKCDLRQNLVILCPTRVSFTGQGTPTESATRQPFRDLCRIFFMVLIRMQVTGRTLNSQQMVLGQKVNADLM